VIVVLPQVVTYLYELVKHEIDYIILTFKMRD